MLRISTMVLYLCPIPHSPIYSSIAHCCIPTYPHSTRGEEPIEGPRRQTSKQTQPSQSAIIRKWRRKRGNFLPCSTYCPPPPPTRTHVAFTQKPKNVPLFLSLLQPPPLFPSRCVCQSRTNKSHFGSGSFVALGLIWFLCFSVDFQMWGKYARML